MNTLFHPNHRWWRALVAFGLMIAALHVLAGGGFELADATLDGGGGVSSGNGLTLTGTIGQPDAGEMSGDEYTLQGGFWASDNSDLLFKNGYE